MPGDYTYDQGFSEQRARLAGIESLRDPGSQRLLDGLGIGPAWQCLEVGAGGGSLVNWMAKRGAAVLAIDIDTRFIEPLAGTLSARYIHPPFGARPAGARAPDRSPTVLDRLAAALRPGGWIVVEDYDWTGFGFEDDDPRFERVTEAIITFMQQAGFEPRYGRRVVAEMDAVGLTDVQVRAAP